MDLMKRLLREAGIPIAKFITLQKYSADAVMASTMFRADRKETSCSADLPPNNIPTRILDI